MFTKEDAKAMEERAKEDARAMEERTDRKMKAMDDSTNVKFIITLIVQVIFGWSTLAYSKNSDLNINLSDNDDKKDIT